MVDVDGAGDATVSTGDGAVRLVAIRRRGQVVPAATLAAAGLLTGEMLG
jgi:hypothetical protein